MIALASVSSSMCVLLVDPRVMSEYNDFLSEWYHICNGGGTGNEQKGTLYCSLWYTAMHCSF